jgi:phosphatidylglycerophosphatase C
VPPTEKPVVAAFDFDGTVTYRDTLFPFLRHALGAAMFARKGFASLPVLAAYGTGLMANDVAKARTLARFIGGMTLADLQALGATFARDKLPRLVRPRALERLRWHRQQGHRCVIVSASLDLYLEPWAAAMDIDEVLCTRLQVDKDRHVNGALATANCYGAEKLRRLELAVGPVGGYILYAYGDSRGDRELLAAADHAWYRTMPGSRESV